MICSDRNMKHKSLDYVNNATEPFKANVTVDFIDICLTFVFY